MMKAQFFATPADFRKWFEKNHDTSKELLVGFYRRDSGRPSITWPESVDVALCFGWIDGIRGSIDESSYSIRFSPRKSTSTWSAINLKRATELIKLGLMRPAGIKAFEQRKTEKSQIYSYEQRHTVQLDANYEKKLKANRRAWSFFQAQPPWYRRTAIYWVMAAKKEETRASRLDRLIECSENDQPVGPLARAKSNK